MAIAPEHKNYLLMCYKKRQKKAAQVDERLVQDLFHHREGEWRQLKEKNTVR